MWHEIQIIGYLGADPQLQYLQTGIAVCDFSMASSRKYTKSDGTLVDETVWWDITVWGDQAENAHKFLSKGRPALVVGRMKPDENGYPRTFTRNDGSCGARYEVTAREVRYLPDGSGGTRVASTAGEGAMTRDEYEQDDDPPWMPDDEESAGSAGEEKDGFVF